MPTRNTKNPELVQALKSLNQAARHLRNAMQGKIGDVRAVAAAEFAKAKAAARSKTGVVQQKVESALTRGEARLHRVIARAQKALDDAVRRAEKATKPAAKKTPAKKATAAKKTRAAKRPR